MQELLFGDALAQRDFSDPSVEDVEQLLGDQSPIGGWGRGSFKTQVKDLQSLLRDVEGRELEDTEISWVLRLALRKQQGPALLRPSCLRYALLARHGVQSLSFPELQLLALLRVSPHREGDGFVQGVDLSELKLLMDSLNGEIPVPDDEVDSVVREAMLLSGSESLTRKDLMRGLGAWFVNVQRRDSPPEVFLNAWASALLHGKEYHTILIERLRLSLPSVLRSLRRQRKASQEVSARLLTNPAQRWMERCWGTGMVMVLLLGLGLPGSLFAWAIYMGAEHGDDACPKDLDGLLTWFGIIGLAFLFVGCADANADHSSWIGLLLRTILLLFPWVGADWTFHLRAEEQRMCGPSLVFASMWLWTILLILELLGACALCWGAAVFAEHELSLQHLAVRMPVAEDNSP